MQPDGDGRREWVPFPVESGRKYYQKDYAELLDMAVDRYGDFAYLAYARESGGLERFTYSDVKRRIDNIISELSEAGIAPGDRVATIAPAGPHHVILIMALSYMGVTASYMDGSLGGEDIGMLLESIDPCAVFSTGAVLSKIGDRHLEGRMLFAIGDGGSTVARIPGGPDRVSEHPSDGDPEVMIILFSSGTTGRMKGVEITYDSILHSTFTIKKALELDDSPGKGSFLHVLPLNHIAGYIATSVMFFSGVELDFIENVNPSKYHDGLKMFEPTIFLTVPAVYSAMEQKLLDSVRKKGRLVNSVFWTMLRLSGIVRRRTGIGFGNGFFKSARTQLFGRNIEKLLVGASPCKDSTARFFSNIGLEWHNFYATTETGVPASLTTADDVIDGSHVGTVNTIDGIEIRIRDPDEVGIGDIQVRTESIMKGYFKDPDSTDAVFDGDWFITGDSGFVDRAGRLHVVGRKKETIVLQSGKKVSPEDVDNHYSKLLNGRFEMATCGVPVAEGYDEIHGFVARNGISEQEERELKKRIMGMSATSPPMYHLADVHFTDSIPKTSVGKTKRFELKNSLREPGPGSGGVAEEGDILHSIIRKHRPDAEIRPDSRLIEDVGLDSISLFNVKCELESRYEIVFKNDFGSAETVADLQEVVHRSRMEAGSFESVDLSMYPSPRNAKTGRRLRRWSRIVSCRCDIEVTGLENIPDDGSNYLICPNHQTLADPFWVLKAADGRIDWSRMAAMAAKERNVKRFDRMLFEVLGAIPVDRYENPFPSMERAKQCLTEENYTIILFPEGTRTSDGGMLPFKAGAAELSMQTGRGILPVRIEGGHQIFPREGGRMWNIFGLRKAKLRIAFGEMMHPSDYGDSIEMTRVLRERVSNLLP